MGSGRGPTSVCTPKQAISVFWSKPWRNFGSISGRQTGVGCIVWLLETIKNIVFCPRRRPNRTPPMWGGGNGHFPETTNRPPPPFGGRGGWLHNLGKTNHSWHILEQNIVILTTRKVQNGSESGPKWQKKCLFLVRTQKITLFRGRTPKVGVPLRRHRKNVSDYGLYWHVRTLIWRSEKVFWQKSPKNRVFWNSYPNRASMWNIAQIPRVKK